MSDIHGILFNMQVLYSAALGIWAAVIAGQGKNLSGNFWGALATFSILVIATLALGLVMAAQGLRPRDGRLFLYILYMLFLSVIMPGLFSFLRGRDDRSAGISFAVLAFFNAAVAVSMQQRGLVGPWIEL
jgi:hypothetical protein